MATKIETVSHVSVRNEDTGYYRRGAAYLGLDKFKEAWMEIRRNASVQVDGGMRQSLIKAWELMYLCASCMPLSKEIGGYLSEYVHTVAHTVSSDSEIQVLAVNTLNALKRSVKAGPRHIIPGPEEIEALLTGKKLTTIVFFLDETFEEIACDMTTTVADSVEGPYEDGKTDATFSFTDNDFVKVDSGKMNPQFAFMRGAMKIKGSM
ncbi:unnamed protein product [Fraxinus pennsylvanica]|uniref:MyTH4 domain-containing protein n=1 Tax=Fraxinus pennsylvanica TaxID=56036 RepID=A0AAD2A8U2_9LAMI|nr:unnamed protein product [Fraxinus pennsylvanica]